MVTTIAKASAPESVPAFVQKFEGTPDLSAHCAELKRIGYTHFVNVHAKRITIGDLLGEYRIMSAAAFFKGEPPALDTVLSEEIPFIENRKFYSDMSSVGRGQYHATLTPDDLLCWIEFFEANPGVVGNIDDLI